MNLQSLSLLTRIVLVTAVYFLGGILGKVSSFASAQPADDFLEKAFSLVSDSYALVWPPAGIALAAILLFGYRIWPAVLGGGILFEVLNGAPLGLLSVEKAIGSCIGALVSAYLLERFVQFRNSMERIRDVVGFLTFAFLLGAALTSLFDAVSQWHANQIAPQILFTTVLEGWASNALGILILTPCILAWTSGAPIHRNRKLLIEAAVCGIALLGGAQFLFRTWLFYGVENYPLAYLPYPFVVWAALRFGLRGATTSTLIISAMAVYSLHEGRGPFVASSPKQSLILIGTYIAILTTTNLFIAAATAERRRAESVLREREEFFRLISENMTDLVAVIAPDGTRLYNSPSYKTVFGEAPVEFLGTNSFEEVHPDDREKLRKVFEETIRTGEGRRAEYRFVLKDGTFRHVESQGSPIRDENGKVQKLVVLSRDVTDRIKLEGQLRQLQKMESLGQLAGGVAHDFNNMLTVIQGHTSQLLNRESLPLKLAETLKQISNSAEMAANLTRQLLMFSRQQTMQPTSLDLNDVIYNLTKMLRRILGEDIKLQFEGATELPTVFADQGMIGQILMNLSVNSRDAMPRGGKLTIATCVVDIDRAYLDKNPESHPGRFVHLSVNDTGCGIPAENIPHVFEPFFTTKEAGKGTGLGLSTVYGIVKQHHGWVTLQSELGRGTTFHIYLPVSAESAAQQARVSPARPVSGGSETILIVEDLLPLRELLRAILESYGYRILEAPTGVAAMDIWREHQDKIELLLTDMVMPDGISGNELADRLRSMKPTLRVIYTSGHSPDAFPGIELEEGRNFVQKPYQAQKLAETIRSSLNNTVEEPA